MFNAVTCCSGCFSAYRREAILPRMDWWENQTLPGRRVDLRRRPLADQLRAARLAGRCMKRTPSRTRSCRPPSARSSTSRRAGSARGRASRCWSRAFIWRKHPSPPFFTYLSIVLPLLAPVAALHAIVWGPIAHGGTLPLVYIAGHLLAGDGLLALLRPVPGRVQPGVGLRRPVRLLLPRRSCCGRPTTRSPPAAPPPGAPARRRPACWRRRWGSCEMAVPAERACVRRSARRPARVAEPRARDAAAAAVDRCRCCCSARRCCVRR